MSGAQVLATLPDPGPRLPNDPALRGGVAVQGAGSIAQAAHLPAYAAHGVGVTGVSSRDPRRPASSRNPWSATVTLTCDTGATALVRVAGDVRTPSCPFWLHGRDGTLRGSVLPAPERLALDRDGRVTELPVRGRWFVDAFAATMGELLCAVAEDRESAAAHAAGTIYLVLAARRSAEQGGAPVEAAVG